MTLSKKNIDKSYIRYNLSYVKKKSIKRYHPLPNK